MRGSGLPSWIADTPCRHRLPIPCRPARLCRRAGKTTFLAVPKNYPPNPIPPVPNTDARPHTPKTGALWIGTMPERPCRNIQCQNNTGWPIRFEQYGLNNTVWPIRFGRYGLADTVPKQYGAKVVPGWNGAAKSVALSSRKLSDFSRIIQRRACARPYIGACAPFFP